MLRYLLPTMLGLCVLAAGCERREPPKVTAREVGEKVGEAAGAGARYASQEKDEYVARTRQALDDARAEIDGLKAEARKARADAMGKLQRRIDVLEARWRLAERKLSELRSAGGEAWKDLRSGLDRAVEDLKRPDRSLRSS